MTRSRYELALNATVIEAARTVVGEKLPRYLPVMQEQPSEIRELIARLAALDSEERAAERRAASSPLQLPLPPGRIPSAASSLIRSIRRT